MKFLQEKEIEKLRDIIFFIYYLITPWQTLGHCQGANLNNSVLITEFGTCLTQRSPGPLYQGWDPKQGKVPGRVSARIFPVLNSFQFRVFPVLCWLILFSIFCLCFSLTGINFWGMLHHVMFMMWPMIKNKCTPIRTCTDRDTNWLISFM